MKDGIPLTSKVTFVSHLLLLHLCLSCRFVFALENGARTTLNFETDCGAIPGNSSSTVAWENGKLLNRTLSRLTKGDILYIPAKTFHLMGGVFASGLQSITIHVDGTLVFAEAVEDWPRKPNGHVRDCIEIFDSDDITFTSSRYGSGVIDGNGPSWWDYPFVGYAKHLEDRPRILLVRNSRRVLFENLLLKKSPFWTTLFENVNGLEIRDSGIVNRRTSSDGHGVLDASAFNTDGFDVTGKNIWIHDVTIWTQDDCIAIKDGTENVLVERVNASCVGMAIGSMGNSHNRNLTFRDIYMHKSLKPIYLKFRNRDSEVYDPRKPCPCEYHHMPYGLIEDVTFENIIINEPLSWPIWIGPAQQLNTRDPSSCSLAWPFIPNAKCNGQVNGKYRNLVFRNITIHKPIMSAGVMVGHPDNPIENVLFENVILVPFLENELQTQHPFAALPDEGFDEYVQYYLMGIFTFCSICVPACCMRRFNSIRYKQPTTNAQRISRYFPMYSVLLLCTYTMYIHYQIPCRRLDEYFECTGIVNGTARGTTWPVPYCFDNDAEFFADVDDPGIHQSLEWSSLLTFFPTYLVLSLIHIFF